MNTIRWIVVVTIVIYKKTQFINLDDCMNTIRWIVVVTIVISKKTWVY